MAEGWNNRLFHPELENVQEFLQRFKVQNYQNLNDPKGDAASKAMLLVSALPINVSTDIQRRLKPTLLTCATYDQIEKQLLESFSTKKSAVGAAVAFITRKQFPSESIETYAKCLNELSSQCSYKECCREIMLRDVFISGLKSNKLIAILISEGEDKKFLEIVERAKIVEQIALDVEDINPTLKTFALQPKRQEENKVAPTYICYRCGSRGKHYINECYALEMKCLKCGKLGHLAKMCRTKAVSKSESTTTKSTAKNLNQVTKDAKCDCHKKEDGRKNRGTFAYDSADDDLVMHHIFPEESTFLL